MRHQLGCGKNGLEHVGNCETDEASSSRISKEQSEHEDSEDKDTRTRTRGWKLKGGQQSLAIATLQCSHDAKPTLQGTC